MQILQPHNDNYIDTIIMSACRDKKIAHLLERLACLANKKYTKNLTIS